MDAKNNGKRSLAMLIPPPKVRTDEVGIIPREQLRATGWGNSAAVLATATWKLPERRELPG